MAITVKRTGFGQVEPNHLSAQRTAQIYAQLPAKSDIKILENGQFVKYNYAAGVVDYEGAGEWMLVFNEVKLYGKDFAEGYKDYAMKAEDFTPGSDTITHHGVGPFPGQMTPRVFKTNVGDIYTTNCIGEAVASNKAEYAGIALSVGDKVAPDATGYLVKTDDAEGMVWQVVSETTMPDGQPGVKIMRIS